MSLILFCLKSIFRFWNLYWLFFWLVWKFKRILLWYIFIFYFWGNLLCKVIWLNLLVLFMGWLEIWMLWLLWLMEVSFEWGVDILLKVKCVGRIELWILLGLWLCLRWVWIVLRFCCELMLMKLDVDIFFKLLWVRILFDFWCIIELLLGEWLELYFKKVFNIG